MAVVATGFTDIHEDRSENTTNAINNKFNNLEEFITSPTVFNLVGYRLFIHDAENKPFRSFERLKEKGVTKNEIDSAVVTFKEKLKKFEILNIAAPEEKRFIKLLEWMGYYGAGLTKAVTIKRAGSTDFIEITATTENKNLSAYIANTFAEEGIGAYNQSLRNNLENTVLFYNELQDKKKKELDLYLDSLNRFKAMYQVVNYTTEAQNKLQKLANLEMAKEQEKQKISSLTQALYSIKKNIDASDKIDRNTINRKITDLKSRIHILNEKYINGGSVNKNIQDSLQALREELRFQTALYHQGASSESSLIDDLKTRKVNNQIELEVAQSNLYAIEKSIDSVRKEVGTFASKETMLSALESTIAILKAEYLELLTKYNKAKNSAMDVSRLHIAESAQPALNPESSKVFVLSILSGIITFSFAIVLLFLLEYFDNSIKNRESFLNLANQPLLGNLNSIKGKVLNIADIFSGDKDLSPSKSMYLSQIRQIRFHLEQSKDKVFLFTSTQPGEGKTTTLLSFAYSMALMKKRVLIIDTNFKNNTLSNLFSARAGIKNNIPVKEAVHAGEEREYSDNYNPQYENAEVVSGTEVEIYGKWLSEITPSGLSGIDIIGCERSSLSPSEIFAGKPFGNFMEEVRNHYDYIFMESACLSLHSDSKELSPYCDKIINIVAADRSLKESDYNGFDFLSSLNNQYFGCILNKVNPEYVRGT